MPDLLTRLIDLGWGAMGAVIAAVVAGVVSLYFATRKRKATRFLDEALEMQKFVARALQLHPDRPGAVADRDKLLEEIRLQEKSNYLRGSDDQKLKRLLGQTISYLRDFPLPAGDEAKRRRDDLRARWRKHFKKALS